MQSDSYSLVIIEVNFDFTQGPAKKWEEMLLGLGVAGSEPGIEGDEIAPLAKANVATP